MSDAYFYRRKPVQRGAIKSKARKHEGLWERFDHLRTRETGGSIKSLEDSFISLSVPALSTYRYALEAIARQCQPPVAIESLEENLGEKRFPRGKTIFRFAGDAINEIASQYEDMCWWVSKNGLNMAAVPLAAAKISKFDELAGKLYVDGSKGNKLSKELLVTIAKALDDGGFSLRELQPAQWDVIAEYNQKNARQAVKSFQQACRKSRLVRSIRKRLYVARDRYDSSSVSPRKVS